MYIFENTWTLFLEKNKVPTAWMVWPIHLRLNKHLADLPNDTEIIRAMKNAGRGYIEKNIAGFAPKMLHKVCTVLHPLLKNIAMTSPTDRSEVYDFKNAEISKNDMAVESTNLFETQGTLNMELINEWENKIWLLLNNNNRNYRTTLLNFKIIYKLLFLFKIRSSLIQPNGGLNIGTHIKNCLTFLLLNLV